MQVYFAARALYCIRAIPHLSTACTYLRHIARLTPFAHAGTIHSLQVFSATRAFYCIRTHTAFGHNLHIPAANCAPDAIRPCWDYPQLAGLFCGSRTLLHSNPHRIWPQLSHTGSVLCALTACEDFGFVHNLQVYFAAPALHCIREATHLSTACTYLRHIAPLTPFAHAETVHKLQVFLRLAPSIPIEQHAFVHNLHVPAAHCAPIAIHPR